MRLFFCAYALLLVAPSVSLAERMVITKASATYWTATGILEFYVETEKPFDIPGGYLALGVSIMDDRTNRATEWFGLWNDYWTRGSTFDVRHVIETRPRINTVLDPIELSLPLRKLASVLIPFSDTHLTAMPNVFNVTVGGRTLDTNSMEGFVGIDQRIVYVPEPSSVALAGIGGMFLTVHLLRLPGVRRGRGKRRISERNVGSG